MARLTITEHARSDLREIRAHIAKDNPAAGHRMVERLRAKARRLAETSGTGRSLTLALSTPISLPSR